jgi:hypothetical protein
MFDFPGIYKEADDISNKTQKNYLRLLKLFLFFLVLSSLLFSYFSDIWEIKIANAVISLFVLSLSFVFFLYDFQGIWYNARAVAESIKTSCWRYAIKADPYNIDDQQASALLLETMKRIVDMNQDFKKHITACFSCDDQLPESLNRVRSLTLTERIEYYWEKRIVEQNNWYKNKSQYNKSKSNLFFGILIMLSIMISVLLFLSIDKSNKVNYPVELLLSMVSIVFTWVQTKKYKELNKSYALASYEIGFISSQKKKVINEEQLSDYVSNTENAFSREHTQWIARKDN